METNTKYRVNFGGGSVSQTFRSKAKATDYLAAVKITGAFVERNIEDRWWEWVRVA